MKLLPSSRNHRERACGVRAAGRVSRQAADAWRLRRSTGTQAHRRPVHRPISLKPTHIYPVQSDADLYHQTDDAFTYVFLMFCFSQVH